MPISANLREWLAPHAKKTGRVFPHTRAYFHELQRDTAAATGHEADEKTGRAARAGDAARARRQPQPRFADELKVRP